MLYVFFVLLFLGLVAILPIRLRLRMFFDPFKNRLYILVTLFAFINVLSGYITSKNFKLYIADTRNNLSLLSDKDGNKVLNALQKSTFKMLKNAKYIKMNVFIEVSTKDDLILNIFSRTACKILLSFINSYFMSRNPKTKIEKYIIEKKGENNFQLSIDSILHLKIYKVVHIFLYNLFKKLKKERKKEVK